MSIPQTFATRIAGFPPALRQLLESELAAGNEIVEVASCFPAPPAGAYAKLGKPITTRRRATSEGIDFYDRNSSLYSGEWTDAKRFFFILEPPHPPPPEPDMDAIRRASNESVAETMRLKTSTFKPTWSADASPAERAIRDRVAAAPKSVVRRFEDSMIIDYEKWHDGIGYDLSLLKGASPEELKTMEGMVVSRGARDWRDIEALAAFNTDRTKRALLAAFANGNSEIRGAVLQHAPELVSDSQGKEHLIGALRTANLYGGLSQAIDQVAGFHPPEIVAELFRGVLARQGEVAVHFAAMLMFIHGKAGEPFDWQQRPFFLQFATDSRAERESAFRKLCEKIDVDAEKYLGAR